MKCEVLVEGKCFCSGGSVGWVEVLLFRWKCWLGASVGWVEMLLFRWKCWLGGSVTVGLFA